MGRGKGDNKNEAQLLRSFKNQMGGGGQNNEKPQLILTGLTECRANFWLTRRSGHAGRNLKTENDPSVHATPVCSQNIFAHAMTLLCTSYPCASTKVPTVGSCKTSLEILEILITIDIKTFNIGNINPSVS